MKLKTRTYTPSEQLEVIENDERLLRNDKQALLEPLKYLREEFKLAEAKYNSLQSNLEWLERIYSLKCESLDALQTVKRALEI